MCLLPGVVYPTIKVTGLFTNSEHKMPNLTSHIRRPVGLRWNRTQPSFVSVPHVPVWKVSFASRGARPSGTRLPKAAAHARIIDFRFTLKRSFFFRFASARSAFAVKFYAYC